jgi:hypothetical protein
MAEARCVGAATFNFILKRVVYSDAHGGDMIPASESSVYWRKPAIYEVKLQIHWLFGSQMI